MYIIESTFKVKEQVLVLNTLHQLGFFFIDTKLRLFLLEHIVNIFLILFNV